MGIPKTVTRVLLAPDRLVARLLEKNLQQSGDSKIFVDENGNASLNLNNESVQRSMRARMEELSSTTGEKSKD